MKTIARFGSRLRRLSRAFPRGFTLVEMLIVISIICILSAMTIAGLSYGQKKASRERARGEIQALSLAITNYKIDNGDYPRALDAGGATDTLNAQVDLDARTSNDAYKASSLILYEHLSADTNADRTLSTAEREAGKVYFQFKPGMLYPKVALGQTGRVQAIADPFNNVYGYSTIGSKVVSGTANSQQAADEGYNPTFDLWSTADAEKTGTTPQATWITNWQD